MKTKLITKTEFIFNEYEIVIILRVLNYHINNSGYVSTDEKPLSIEIKNAIANSKH